LPNGELDLASLEERLDDTVALVAVTAVSNVLGTVNPVRAIARQAHAVGARVLVDAAQAAPHMMIDVVDWDCDIAVFSGHKMMGPTGIGVLYARGDLLEAMPPWMGGGEMINTVTRETATWADLPYRMEAGTPNVAGAIGLGVAVEYLSALGRDSLQAHDQALLTLARNRLAAIDGVTVVGHPAQAAGLVSFAVEGVHPHDMAQVADEIGVAIRAGSMCAQPLMHALGFPALSRASFGPYTNESDIDQLVSAVQQAMEFFA
jgi:cysteine desulfurase/selenocysteine lyase